MKKAFLTSPYLHLFYTFFVLSWMPYFFVQLGDQRWVYTLFYRPNGIVENMTVLLYVCAFALGVWALLKSEKTPQLILMTLWAAFLIGEETRWALPYFYEDIKALPFDSIQDILEVSFLGWGGEPTGVQVIVIFVTRLLTALTVCAGLVWLWIKRHEWPTMKTRFLGCGFSPYIVLYAVFFVAAIFVEVILQPGPRKLDYLEETLELNAACLWMLIGFLFLSSRHEIKS